MQTLDLKAKGKFSHPNPLGEVPPGALLIAENVVIDREGTTELRRGLGQKYGTVFTLGASERFNKLFAYQDRLIVSYASKLARDSDGAGTWTDYSGSYSPPTGANRIRAVESNKNFYFTSSVGIKKLDSISGTIGSAGGVKALDGTGATSGVTGFLADGNQVAYRVVFGIKDANSNKIIGTPSQRILVTNNSGGTRDIALTLTIPSGLTTSHFYQIYRSGASGGVSTEPNDELQLIVEKNLTAPQIAALAVTYTDQTPDTMRGATLYTSPSQQGILQANEPPPLAKDMALYKNTVLYANTISKHRLNINLIAIGGSSGLVNDDTITIAGTVYTGKGAETPSAGQFKISTGGTAAENIDATARSLIRVINQYTTNTLVYAYYLTGFDDVPGQILVEERGIGGAAFVAIASRGGAFSPELPSSGSTYTSTNETAVNRIYAAKADQPEAVPTLNYLPVGSAQQEILRIIALRDSVFILKEDGVYRLTGETISDFRVSLFDNTTFLKCQESAVAFNNQVMAFTSQGIAAISDSGVAIMSRPIESDLLEISSSQFTNFDTASFAVSYESDRKYLFFTVSETTDDFAVNCWVFNSVTNTWTEWPVTFSAGIINPADNKLYVGSADTDTKYVYRERKDYALTDYADDEVALVLISSSGTTVTLTSTVGIEVGDSLVQFTGSAIVRNSIITEVTDATHVEVTDETAWVAGVATAYRPIPAEVQYCPVHCGNPALVKHFQLIKSLFSNANFDEILLTFKSDLSVTGDEVELAPFSEGPWGLFPFGGVAWGGSEARIQPIPTWIPLEKARAHWLDINIQHNQALTAFALVGISVFYNNVSARTH